MQLKGVNLSPLIYFHPSLSSLSRLGKPAAEEAVESSGVESTETLSVAVSPLPVVKPVPKKPAGADRWSHDRFDISEQAPKSHSELVSAYGYDIRSEDGPPKVKRNKHYGRGPTKYDRNWEDENAYGKQMAAKRVPRGPPKSEDFPGLNERRPKKSSSQSRDEHHEQRGGGGNETERNYTGRQQHHHHRDRHQGSNRSGGGGFRGGENSREFRGRHMDGGRDREPRGHRDSGRMHRRRDGEAEQQEQSQQPKQTFNGMSFTNSNLGHAKANTTIESEGGPRAGHLSGADDLPVRMVPPTANSSRQVNYGSGRLQRRDEKSGGAGHNFQSQVSEEGESSSGGLPLHAPVHQSQPPLPKRYSEKRQGMRNEQQSHQQQVPLPTSTAGIVGMEHMHPHSVGLVQHQQPSQPSQHLQQSSGPPPPPFLSNRSFVPVDVAATAAVATAPIPQAQPIPAQYANYYSPEFMPQSQSPAVAGALQQAQASGAAYQTQPQTNGTPAQMLNYVPAMQAAAPPQGGAQYQQYPGYQNYPTMVSGRWAWVTIEILINLIVSFRPCSRRHLLVM